MMRDKLAEYYNFDHVDKLTTDKVKDFYAMRKIDKVRSNSQSNLVEYPLYESSEMDSNHHWNTLLDFRFADGSAFLDEPLLEPKFILGIPALMLTLVELRNARE